MVPSSLTTPILRSDLPLYPPYLQLLKVTSTTVPGPFGYASSSLLAPLLYVASTQQLRTDTILPRDREPCLADDVNGFGLQPGYYLGRLANSHQSLPVYEVIGGSYLGIVGLTSDQITKLILNLTPTQMATLVNLTPCQLQTFVQLPPSNLQMLTGSLTPTQLTNLVDDLSLTQLQTLVRSNTPAQLLILTSSIPSLYKNLFPTLPPPVITTLAESLTGTQLNDLYALTTPQLQIVGQLPVQQLIVMTNALSPPQMATLVGSLVPTQLQSLVTTLTTAQLQTLVTALPAPGIQTLVQALLPSQLQSMVANLTPGQLQSLVKYQPSTVTAIVTSMTVQNIKSLLSLTGPPPDPVAGSQQQFPGIPLVTSRPSSTPLTVQGYAPIVADASGKIWILVGGQYLGVTLDSAGSGGGGGGGTTVTEARLTDSSPSAVSSGVLTTASFDTDDYDTGGYITAHAILAPAAGKYRIGAFVAWPATAGGYRLARIDTAGALAVKDTRLPTILTQDAVTLSVECELGFHDTVQLLIQQTSGGNITPDELHLWISSLG